MSSHPAGPGTNCGTCVFGVQEAPDPTNLQKPRNIFCYRYPPQAVLLPNGHQGSIYPVVRVQQWCGEHGSRLAS